MSPGSGRYREAHFRPLTMDCVEVQCCELLVTAGFRKRQDASAWHTHGFTG